jgi:hypothetical protein
MIIIYELTPLLLKATIFVVLTFVTGLTHSCGPFPLPLATQGKIEGDKGVGASHLLSSIPTLLMTSHPLVRMDSTDFLPLFRSFFTNDQRPSTDTNH